MSEGRVFFRVSDVWLYGPSETAQNCELFILRSPLKSWMLVLTLLFLKQRREI